MGQIMARIPEDIFKRFTVQLAKDGTSKQRVIEDAVLDYLEKAGEDITDLRAEIETERTMEAKKQGHAYPEDNQTESLVAERLIISERPETIITKPTETPAKTPKTNNNK